MHAIFWTIRRVSTYCAVWLASRHCLLLSLILLALCGPAFAQRGPGGGGLHNPIAKGSMMLLGPMLPGIGVMVPGGSSSSAGSPNTWNPADRVNTTLSNGNLTAAQTTNNGGVRASVPAALKFYFEATITVNLTAGAGIATNTANLSNVWNTITNASYVYFSTGQYYYNGLGAVGTLGSFAAGDIASIAVDLVNKRIWYRRNAGNWNASAGNDPATNVGGIDISSVFTSASAYPLAAFSNTNPAVITANFGSTAFVYAVPSGFSNAAAP